MADDLCFSRSSLSYNFKKNPNFQLIPCIILHDLSLLCSFIMSQPLYFTYFIFFSPYLIKLISFISPLFIATTLLSLLLTTTTAFCPKLPQLELGILQTVIEELKSNLDDVRGGEAECNCEDFEIYKIVFDGTSLITIGDEDDDELEEERKEVSLTETVPEDSVDGGWRNDINTSHSATDKLEKEKGLETLFEELDRFEDLTTAIETSPDSDKVIGELRKEEPSPVKKVSSGSEAEAINSSDDNKITQNPGRDGVVKVDKSSSWRLNSSTSLGSHGSMREKEWRRTLACKLFEERHNSRGGEEGMDSLWEAYENDNSKNRKETMIKKKKKMKKKKKKKKKMMKNKNKGGINCCDDDDDDDDDDDEEEEEEMSNGQLCCLQALKLSTGKMNLGMGKPNLVKISKALKGFGWLHHVSSKHGMKS